MTKSETEEHAILRTIFDTFRPARGEYYVVMPDGREVVLSCEDNDLHQQHFLVHHTEENSKSVTRHSYKISVNKLPPKVLEHTCEEPSAYKYGTTCKACSLEF